MNQVGEEKVVMTTCNMHCGGQCILKVYVKDGVITKIETDDGEEPQYRACLRGRAWRKRVYSPDRLKWPLRRVGKRGEGKFERISWDEALETIVAEIKRVKDNYGPAAILCLASSAAPGSLNVPTMVYRLFGLAGGFTGLRGSLSYGGGIFASQSTYGVSVCSNSRDDLLNSRLIIMWGWDPASTIAHTRTDWYLLQAKEAVTKIMSIDARYTDSAATFEHQWIPIIPGTDAAMLIAMAYVIIKENLQDQKFLNTYTIGFDRFRDYLIGVKDGIAKTPRWAEGITGVPATTIYNLAREYALTKPAALIAGIGPGRSAYGEQYHRAAMTLAAITGNIGIPGGSTGGISYFGIRADYPLRIGKAWTYNNPVDNMAPPLKEVIPIDSIDSPLGHNSGASILRHKIGDAMLRGKSGGYFADYKLLYVVQCQPFNSHSDINEIVKASENLEFIVVHEQFMTPTAKYADILLPGNTSLERQDISVWHAEPKFYGFRNKVIDSLYESKSDLEICTELASRLGISDFNNKTEDQLLRDIAKESDIPDYEVFKNNGYYKPKFQGSYVAFKKQIEDPFNNPFPTPSGKIEIYSKRIADENNQKLPPIPTYIESWEGRKDMLTKKYPLQLINCHSKRRAHTQFDNIPWLKELIPQTVSINSADAWAREISNGDLVRVWNDRGEMIIQAKVTERIIPGAVEIPHGAWFDPDENGVDRGGCPNILTNEEVSPGGAYPSNTCLVQIQKA